MSKVALSLYEAASQVVKGESVSISVTQVRKYVNSAAKPSQGRPQSGAAKSKK